MIRIISPDSNLPEKRYIFDYLFSTCFGLSYEVEWRSEAVDYTVILPNQIQCIIEDHFFIQFPEPGSYIDAANIPTQVSFAENIYTAEPNIPVLFGGTNIISSGTAIRCQIDIVATLFFMLTRWEEYVCLDRDAHGRFHSKNSLAYQYHFLHRPVVDETVEMMWAILTSLDPTLVRAVVPFTALVTHDVDALLKWTSVRRFIWSMLSDLVRKKNPLNIFFTIFGYCIGRKRDPYDTFNYIMNISERYGLHSHFFFMVGGQTPHDRRYDIQCTHAKNLMAHIQLRGHQIGYHPSYDTYRDSTMFEQEVSILREMTNNPVISGRQHYLRFSAPETWGIWSRNAMQWDSTLGFAETLGFRAGTCRGFPVFDFLKREPIQLIEVPLSMMEATCINYMALPPVQMKLEVEKLLGIIRKYRGTFVLLWHNSSLDTYPYLPYKPVYEWLLSELAMSPSPFSSVQSL